MQLVFMLFRSMLLYVMKQLLSRVKMMKVSIILPTYNERENIVELIEEIYGIFESENDFEIVVVDDNSPDGTAGLVKEVAASRGNINLIVRKTEKSLTSSLRTGIQNSSGEILIIMDTDFSHPPNTIPHLIENVKNADIVVASRYIKGGSMIAPMYKYMASRLMNYAIKLILGISVYDSTGGFLAVRKKIFDRIDVDRIFSGYGYGDYCFKLFFELKRENIKIKEVPFVYGARKAGKSKTNLVVVGANYIKEALKTRFGSMLKG